VGLLLTLACESDAASLGSVDEPRRVALALGSGGARGYAQIGVIEVLEERGFEIAGVAGSSMEALVGGVWAAGKLAEFEGWARGLTRADVLRMLDVSLRAPGAMSSSIGAMQTIVNRCRLAGSPPDVLVTIPGSDVRMPDFHRAEPMIELGRAATAEVLEEAGV
jgi:predicted acylesterase/phospholipase RssA